VKLSVLQRVSLPQNVKCYCEILAHHPGGYIIRLGKLRLAYVRLTS